eukprot:SAG22_NODE_47_length_24699_cov_13.602317_5_plen_463_part_00
MQVLAALFGAALAAGASAAGPEVTATKWCDNSFRIKVSAAAPGDEAADTAAERAKLATVLQAQNMTELPGALVDTHCGPASPGVKLAAGGAAATNGNLKLALSAAGALQATAVDTGKVLFSAQVAFSVPKGNPPPPPADPASCAAAKEGMDQTGGKVVGSVKDLTPAACCAACLENPECDAWVTGADTPVGKDGCFFVSNPTGTVKKLGRTMGMVRMPSNATGRGEPRDFPKVSADDTFSLDLCRRFACVTRLLNRKYINTLPVLPSGLQRDRPQNDGRGRDRADLRLGYVVRDNYRTPAPPVSCLLTGVPGWRPGERRAGELDLQRGLCGRLPAGGAAAGAERPDNRAAAAQVPRHHPLRLLHRGVRLRLEHARIRARGCRGGRRRWAGLESGRRAGPGPVGDCWRLCRRGVQRLRRRHRPRPDAPRGRHDFLAEPEPVSAQHRVPHSVHRVRACGRPWPS